MLGHHDGVDFCMMISPHPEGVMFQDREEAGERLAEHLAGMGFECAVVLGIPRGGVVVAAPIA